MVRNICLKMVVIADFGAQLKKYSWSNFKHEILISGLTRKEAEQAEIDTIAKYDATNRYKGYNIAHGGNGGKVYKVHPEGCWDIIKQSLKRKFTARC